MIRRSLYRSDLMWLGLIVAAIAAHWLLPNFQSDVPTNSFRTGPRGKKAFYLIADRLEYLVSRNFQPLPRLLRSYAGSESETVLILLGPARMPTPAEWEGLASFVEAGGALLFAAPVDDPIFDAKPFNVASKELKKPLSADGATPVQLDLGNLKGKFSWQSTAELLAPEATHSVVVDGSVQAVTQTMGSGVAIFVATDRPFDNRVLTWPDNALLAFRLLEASGYRSEAIFDESLNTSGTPKVVAILLDQPLRPLTLHLFVVLAAFGWWGSRRFGPLLPPSVGARSDIVAHADAVGMLQYKARDGRAPLRYYLHQLRTELKLRKLSGTREDRILDPIARRLNRPIGDIRNAFKQAAVALKSEKLDRATAAKQIRRLAKIRSASRQARRESNTSRR